MSLLLRRQKAPICPPLGVGENAFIYIADSALVNPANLEHLSGGQPFIRRLPATYAECGRAISEPVAANRWEELGQHSRTKPTANRPATLYRVAEATVTLYDKPYRAVVVHSSAHDKSAITEEEWTHV